ncbi:MAG TPA: ATP synthase subunit I [Acidimicrobiia bacterium]|nr:ATP synthase subunit I [Acidimicrobiia bacterium]
MDPSPAIADATPVAFEGDIARDLARRAVIVSPLVIVALGLWRGWPGAVSAAIGIVLVILNFLVAARLITWAAERAPGVLAAVILGGFLARLVALTLIVLALQDQSFIDLPVLVLTVAVTHLGLLVWETRHVGLSLAAPGLKPRRTGR